MRVATWNVNSVVVRLPQVLAWLGTAEPDVLCLQELKCSTDAFPYEEIRELGYEAQAHGTGRWNGVAILSKVGFEDVVRDLPDQPGFQAEDSMIEVREPRAIAATCGPVRVWSVYVPNGREVEHPHYFYKLKWLDALRAASVQDAAGERPYAVLGDFNIAPTDADLWDPSAYEGMTHVTAPEREALAALQGTGLQGRAATAAEVRPAVQLLGLPAAGVPEEPRHADRFGAGQQTLRDRGHRRVRRP